MAVQVIAAAAKSLIKKAGQKASQTVARAKKKGDIATNARKRYYRSAERNLKKAEQTSGATSARYRRLARQDFEDALSTYDKTTTQRFSKPIQRLAEEFGYNLEEQRKKFKGSSERANAISRSRSVLESVLQDPNIRREREARAILNDDEIGSRVLGGLVDVWREPATVIDSLGKPKIDKTKILPSLFDYFGVDNVADLLDKVEEALGEGLYADPDSREMYEVVKLELQTKVASNTLVA